MTLFEVLFSAQRLLAGDKTHGPGWTGPEDHLGRCKRIGHRDSLGLPVLELCPCDDEAVVQHTVESALREAARRNDALTWAAWDILRVLIAPSIIAEENFFRAMPAQPAPQAFRMWQVLCRAALLQVDLEAWLRAPERTLKEVLELFDTAVLKAKRGFDA